MLLHRIRRIRLLPLVGALVAFALAAPVLDAIGRSSFLDDPPPDPIATRVYGQAASSTALMEVGSRGDCPASLGPGFHVSPHLLATRARVTGNLPRCDVRPVNGSDSLTEGRVVHADPLKDVAAVYADVPSTALRLRADPPTPGVSVFVISDPQECWCSRWRW